MTTSTEPAIPRRRKPFKMIRKPATFSNPCSPPATQRRTNRKPTGSRTIRCIIRRLIICKEIMGDFFVVWVSGIWISIEMIPDWIAIDNFVVPIWYAFLWLFEIYCIIWAITGTFLTTVNFYSKAASYQRPTAFHVGTFTANWRCPATEKRVAHPRWATKRLE